MNFHYHKAVVKLVIFSEFRFVIPCGAISVLRWLIFMNSLLGIFVIHLMLDAVPFLMWTIGFDLISMKFSAIGF